MKGGQFRPNLGEVMSGPLHWRCGATALALTVLAGCSADKVLDAVNPINWYRDATGASKNDTPPDAANTANLEAGSKEPYPDLGSVPNEPTRGLTKEQKKQLAEGLISDRDNARYTDQQERTGNAGATVQPQTKVPAEQLPYAGGSGATPSENQSPPQGPNSPRPPGQPTTPTMNATPPTALPPTP